jgi:[DsrC]-trisulfide reductase subunit M
MNVLISLAVVACLFVVGMFGPVAAPAWIFAVALPYAALATLVVGVAVRVMRWAAVPVPFRIPTTCGQQKSHPWIRQQKLENPSSKLHVFGRMALEILFFRSLARNTRTELRKGRGLVYGTDLSLWAGALAMHWALAVVLIRHLRLFTDPVPGVVTLTEHADGFLEIGLPPVNVTTVLLLVALLYLLYRRLANARVRYISLPEDYFALFLLLGIAGSGAWMRHISHTDVAAVKELALSLAHFSPAVPSGISPLFFGHLFLVCVLAAYFPFGKLVHAPGVFLSPTRNMANNNRAVRHVNPWDYPVKVHTYEEYEDEFRDKMIAAGLPVDNGSPAGPEE